MSLLNQALDAAFAVKALLAPPGKSTCGDRFTRPLLCLTTTGDRLSPVSDSRPLETAALAAGAGEQLRMLYVQAPGHCTLTVAEIGAALATVTERIDTGRWPATTL